MLTPQSRFRAKSLLSDLGLARIVLRFMDDPTPPAGIFYAIPDRSISFGLALAAMVLDAHGGKALSPAEVKNASVALRRALKISNDENDALEGALSFARLLDAKASVAAMKRFLAEQTSADARRLMAAAGASGQLLEKLSEIEKTDFAPAPLITGDDLTAVGLTPGPVFKRVLDAVYDAQLEDRVTTKAQAMQMAVRLARGE